MLKKSVILVVLATFLLAGCSGASVASSGAYSAGLSVNGVGEVSLPPDVAYVTIGVHTEATDVSGAVSQNADQVASVMAALAGMGVAQEDMQTSNFSLYTGQSYDQFTGQPTGPLYTVDNTVNVTVRNLGNMGNLLDGAISAGANSIWGVQFDLDDKTEEQAQARDLAVADAKAEAEALAAAAGVTLGEIQSISYTSDSYNYYPQYGLGGGGGDMGGGAATSIVPGLITVSAQVYITYTLP
ncbi:MAG: SIMPL domain-containing protein [Anaerolineales bacterium]